MPPVNVGGLGIDGRSKWSISSVYASEYGLSEFAPMRFEIAKKEAALNMRLPSALLEAVKIKAASKGVPYTRYVRMLLEADIAKSH